jgi:hypothetical protein
MSECKAKKPKGALRRMDGIEKGDVTKANLR